MRRSRRLAGRLLLAVAGLLTLASCTTADDGDRTVSPATTATPGPTTSPTAPDQSLEQYGAELHALTNEVRRAEDLPELAPSSCAQQAAVERAEALVGTGELEHAPLAPVIADCAPATTAAENLVNSSATPAEVIEAWLGSPGHRANIVDPALTELGVGCVADGAGYLCAQVFLGL